MTRAAIKHGEEHLRRAMLAGDGVALALLFDDESVFSSPVGALLDKEGELALNQSGRQRLTRLDARDLGVTLFGEQIAVVTVIAELEGTLDGVPFVGTFRYVRTWRREHEREWRIIASSATAIADASGVH